MSSGSFRIGFALAAAMACACSSRGSIAPVTTEPAAPPLTASKEQAPVRPHSAPPVTPAPGGKTRQAAPGVAPDEPAVPARALPQEVKGPGRVCVARLDRSRSPGKGSASVELWGDGPSPVAQARGEQERERGFDVQVDQLAPVRVNSLRGGEVSGLALGGRHRVQVKTPAGAPIASFEFSFEEYASDVVCVHDDAFYANWRIKRADRLDRCHCTEQARKLRKRDGALVL